MKRILALIKTVFLLTEETNRNRKDIEDLQKQTKEVMSAIERLTYEIRRVSERDDNEREKIMLRLENELLRFERRLPSGGNA